MAVRSVALALACVALGVQGALLTANAREQELEAAYEAVLDPPVSPQTKVVQYQSPIQRVVALLQKMKAELEADGKKEAEMYDKMVCWCETQEKEKTKAIADAEAKDKDLVAEIEERVAKSAELYTNIEKAKEQIAEIDDMLKNKARPMRENEASEFRDGEKDLVQAIKNLENAITVLSRHHGSLLQAGSAITASLRAIFRDLALRYEELQGDRMQQGGSNPLAGRLATAFIAVRTETARQGERAESGMEMAQRELISALNPA